MSMSMRLTEVPLAIAGIIAPIWFITLVVVQGIVHPDYSHIALPISALTAWPSGWIQRLNFYVTATLMAAFTISVHQSVRPTRRGLVGIALLLASCGGIFIAGLFPWINVNGVPTETPQHVVGAVLAFFCGSTGLVVLSRRMTSEPRWQDLSSYLLYSGLAMFVLFIVVGFFAVDEGTPFHRWAGLLQRVLVAIWFAAILVMARRVLRLAGVASVSSPGVPE
jgi:hypothetical membrane protein